MLLGIIAMVGLGALVLGCADEDSPADSRRRPEHEDGGMPSQGRDVTISQESSASSNVLFQANALFGNGFELLIQGRKNGREGCTTLQVRTPLWQAINGHQARFEQQVRWASYPASSASSREVRLRSGDYRLEEITQDYGAYPQLGLRYYLTGTYDSLTHHLLLSLRNVDLQSQRPSAMFASPLYESMPGIRCRANPDFSNEFFVLHPSGELAISLDSSSRQAVLCEPCTNGVERISFEIR